MGEYEDTVKDIKKTFGFVPGFMKGLPQDVLDSRLAFDEEIYPRGKQDTFKVQGTLGFGRSS